MTSGVQMTGVARFCVGRWRTTDAASPGGHNRDRLRSRNVCGPWGQHSNKLWALRAGEVRHGDTLLVKLDEAVVEGTEVLVG
jgi:hypothetical protein